MLFLKCARHIFAFTCVLLHQKGCFCSCAPTSKSLLFLSCICIKMFAFSQVHRHHNGCFHSCMLTSTCLLLLVCAYIVFCVLLCTPSPKVWIFSCAPTYECLHVPFCACIKCVIFACATTSKCLLSLVCVCIKIFAFSTSKWLHVIVYANI